MATESLKSAKKPRKVPVHRYHRCETCVECEKDQDTSREARKFVRGIKHCSSALRVVIAECRRALHSIKEKAIFCIVEPEGNLRKQKAHDCHKCDGCQKDDYNVHALLTHDPEIDLPFHCPDAIEGLIEELEGRYDEAVNRNLAEDGLGPCVYPED
jgi:hypothetical protein